MKRSGVKIVTAAQMAAIEQAAARAGVSTDTLMENAGLAVAQEVRKAMGGAAGVRVLALIGPGNNGSDGLVAAWRLRRWGAEVTAYVVAGRPEADPKMDAAIRYGVKVVRAADDPALQSLDRLLSRSRLVLDAVLGTGRSRPLSGTVKDVLLRLNQTVSKAGRPPVFALDLPTGLNADTSEVDPACPAADVTLALGYPKAGQLRAPGTERVGELRVLDIGLPPGLSEEAAIDLELLTSGWVASRLPARPANAHKGAFGHALVVAGSRHYVGASYLASQAAVRTGAGLTSLASPRCVYPIAAAKSAEVIHLPLAEDAEGRISPEAVEDIGAARRRFSALAVGCGLGWSAGTTEFIQRLLCDDDPAGAASRFGPILVDADGLNNLSQVRDWPSRVSRPLILTPHPGEMATLTGLTVGRLQADRVATAKEWAARWQCCVVLKGANTLIADADGMVWVSPFVNPALATGGTGDVLSGIIVGLLAQGLTPADAASCGVYLHGLAAQAVAERTGDAGLAASDLLDAIPPAMHRLRRDKGSSLSAMGWAD